MSDGDNNKIPRGKNTCRNRYDVIDPYVERSDDQADPARKILDPAGEEPPQTNTREKDHFDNVNTQSNKIV